MLGYLEALQLVLERAEPLPAAAGPGGGPGPGGGRGHPGPEPVPPFTNSAMDGFALRAGDGSPRAASGCRWPSLRGHGRACPPWRRAPPSAS